MYRYKKKERIGRLNKRVLIQEETASRDDFGAETLTWDTFGTVWASTDFKPGGSDERQIIDKKTAITRVDFTIRYLNTIDEKMRLVWDGKGWDILSILDKDENGQFQVIEAIWRNGQHDVTGITIDGEEVLIDDTGDTLTP